MYSFKYQENKTFSHGTIVLRVPGGDDTTIDAPVHTDFLRPVSDLLRKMEEDVDPGLNVDSITLPAIATPAAVDEFLCTMYKIEYEVNVDMTETTIDEVLGNMMTYISVLDFFQAKPEFYADKDRLIPNIIHQRRPGFRPFDVEPVVLTFEGLVNLLPKLENFREMLPCSFLAVKKEIVRKIVEMKFDSSVFAHREDLVALRPDTLVDIWKASQITQKMVWASEDDVGDRRFRKRKLEACDMEERSRIMSNFNRGYYVWEPSFMSITSDDIHISIEPSHTWPVLLTTLALPVSEVRSETLPIRLYVSERSTTDGLINIIKPTFSGYYGGKVFIRGTFVVRSPGGREIIVLDKWTDQAVVSEITDGGSLEFDGRVRFIKH